MPISLGIIFPVTLLRAFEVIRLHEKSNELLLLFLAGEKHVLELAFFVVFLYLFANVVEGRPAAVLKSSPSSQSVFADDAHVLFGTPFPRRQTFSPNCFTVVKAEASRIKPRQLQGLSRSVFKASNLQILVNA